MSANVKGVTGKESRRGYHEDEKYSSQDPSGYVVLNEEWNYYQAHSVHAIQKPALKSRQAKYPVECFMVKAGMRNDDM